MRQFNEQKHKASQGMLHTSLQESLDLLKIYTSAAPYLQKGNAREKQLATQVVEVAKKYNELVRHKVQSPATLRHILKQFFSKIGRNRDHKNLSHHEIHIPYISTEIAVSSPHKITRKDRHSDKILSVLQSVQRNSDADYSAPKQPELDLFRTKCLTLIREQDTVPLSLEEAFLLIQTSPITYTIEEGVYLVSDNILHLHQTLSPLPGIEMSVVGSFQRDPFHPDLAIPIKGSFQRACHIEQTGFCHPIQYVGVALHEKLFPNCILRPQMCPKFARLLEKKQELSLKLLPDGSLYKKAKSLLRQKIELFKNSNELFSQVSKLALAQTLGTIDHTPNWYEELSYRSAKFGEQAFAYPINRLQEEWLLKRKAELLANPYTESCSIMLKALQEAQDEAVLSFGKAGISLYLMQLSEHLSFEPQDLTQFERILLTALVRQQLIFIYELEELDEQDLYNHLKNVIEEETALFNGLTSNDKHTLEAQELANELFQYYSVRFETA